MDYDYSPRAWEKVTYAGTQCGSFPQGSRDLLALAELEVSPERVRRATELIGEERVAQRDRQLQEYEELPLPARQQAPAGVVAPQAVAIEMDGGRLQIFDRQTPERDAHEGFWREDQVGLLSTLATQQFAEDPCPQLPETFVDPERMCQLTREIKGFSSPGQSEASPSEEASTSDEPTSLPRPGRPELLARSVIASCQSAEQFGKLLAAEAHRRCFFLALLKAFIADGSETNWGVWRRHFSDYVPIVDFIHALTYVYAAALAGQAASEGWRLYRQWAQWLWSGQVSLIIAALEERQQREGAPDAGESETSSRSMVAKTLTYLSNQQSRMKYDEYRRAGLPITSAHIESTVKQINRRMKGTEKFWSHGVEAMLTLAGDYLSDTPTLPKFWHDRHHRLTGTRSPLPA